MDHTKCPSLRPVNRPSSPTSYRVAMTASMPSRSAKGRMRCSGVVVASTTGRPASRCSSMSIDAKGPTIGSRTSAATSAASAKASAGFPFATRTA